ncbi:MAG: hypothetical protein AB1646_04090 [Thermodesulfobacteriota bacterium]
MPARPKSDGTLKVEWNKIRRRVRSLRCRWSAPTDGSGVRLRLVQGRGGTVCDGCPAALPGKFPGTEPYQGRVRHRRRLRYRRTVHNRSVNSPAVCRRQAVG